MTPLTFTEHGIVGGFPYHDGFIDGVLVDADRRELHVSLRSESGERRVITASGVVDLCVSHFRFGNIVMLIYFLPTGDADFEGSQHQRMLEKRFSASVAQTHPAKNVFFIENSFGADVVAICDSIHVSDEGARLGVQL